MFKQLISLATSAGTLTTMWLLGRKDHRGWIAGLCSQVVWAIFIVSFGAWGLAPLSVCLVIMYSFNLRKWLRDDRPFLQGDTMIVEGDPLSNGGNNDRIQFEG